MSRTVLVNDLVNYFSSSLGESGQKDLFFYWLEEAIGVIREQAWPWNWQRSALLTRAQNAEASPALFTWTEGNSYLVCSAPLATLNYLHTGRKVMIGDEVYRIIDVGHTNTSRIYVDRPIKGSDAVGASLTFFRDEYSFPTSKIRTVEIDGYKVPRYSEAYFKQRFYTTYLLTRSTPSTPLGYVAEDWHRLEPPAYSPVVNSAVIGTWETAGTKVEYFFTRYDPESGVESPPGPKLIFTSVASQPNVTYNNPAGNIAEGSSYPLRLYRSLPNPSRDRCPMFLVQERTPAAATFADTMVGSRVLHSKPRFYDGPRAVAHLVYAPDAERRTLTCEHVHNWAYRTYEEEYVEMGTNNQVTELLRLYLTGVINLAGRAPDEYRKQIIAFRQQMNYLATEARNSGETDVGPENYIHDVAGESEDWVDELPGGTTVT